MINFKLTYDKLHSYKIEDVIYIARKYRNILTDENKNIAEDIENKQKAFSNLLENIYHKRFLLVTGARNNNMRLVRKYFSTETMRNWTEAARVREMSVSAEKSVFVNMPTRAYEKMKLNDKSSRYLPNSPSTILEQIAVQIGCAENPTLKFFMGPDASELASLVGYTGTIFNFEDYKAERASGTPRVRAVQLPLFSTRNGSKTYQELINDGDYVICIQRGNVALERNLENTPLWSNGGAECHIKKIYNWTKDEKFNKKFAYIKVGDYKRIQKYIKTEVPLWTEMLRKNVTADTINALVSLGSYKVIKDMKDSSLFNIYAKQNYKTAKRVAAKLGTLSEKQKQFLEDLRIAAEVRDQYCNPDVVDYAEILNNRLMLGFQITPIHETKIDLELNKKYPWHKILNSYHMDEDQSMEMIFNIVERY